MSSPPLRSIFVNIFLVLVATCVGFLLCEIIVRVVDPQKDFGVPLLEEVNGVTLPLPNVRGRCFVQNAYNIHISTSSQRFRGLKNFQSKPKPGVVRIAMLGDSFTFGIGANEDEAYPAQLSRVLQEHLTQRTPAVTVEVINAGIPGTGTGDQALWYDHWVRHFHPQIVVLNVAADDVRSDLMRRLFVLDKSGKASPRSLQGLRAAD